MRYLFFVCFLAMFSITVSAQGYKYHTVKKGETVYSISKDYKISEEDIYKYNPDAKNGIEESSKLVIPVGQGSTGSTTSTGTSNRTTSNGDVQFKEHKVQKKETLFSLSKEYNVPIDDIKRYNKQLYSNELQKGETIKIPVAGTGRGDVQAKEPETTSKKEIRQKFDDNEVREHVVLPKETKFGIARKYGLTVTELEALNPTVEVLQPGIMLKVGTNVSPEPVVLLDDSFDYYEVKPKETLFGLAQRFHVTQDSILALNPIIEEQGLEWGMVLKVPNPENQDTENWEKPGELSAAEELQAKKVDLKDTLSNFSPKRLVFMLPYNLNSLQADSTDVYKNAILNDRVLRLSLDFYSGAKMAIADAKELGISTNVKVYDTKRDAGQVASLIATNNFNDVDAVIGPFLQSTTEAAVQRLAGKNIPVFTPLSDKDMRGGKNLFIARPSEEQMTNTMIDYLKKFGQGKNVIIVSDDKSYAIKNKLTQLMPAARVVNANNGYVAESSLKNVMMPNAENWVLLESSSVGVISSTVSALNRLLRDKLDIKLFTTHKNSSYDNESISNSDLGKLSFHYPSVDKEFDPEISAAFIEKYTKENGVTPNQYAVRGYDLTMDVLLRLASSKDIYASFKNINGFTEYNENKFLYELQSSGSFRNKAVYILQINPDLTLQIADDSKSNLFRQFKD